MPIAYDMKSLAQDIEVSYGQRVAFLSDLFKKTSNSLKTFRRDQQKMSTDLWDFLTSNRETREGLVQEFRQQNKKELANMAERLTSFLVENNKIMKKETADLMNQIRDFLSTMEEDVSTLLTEFKKDRQTMATGMRKELASMTKRRMEQVKRTLSAFAAEQENRSNKLREELSSFQKELTRTVKQMRAPVISDLREAKGNWQTLTKIMAAKRASKVTKAVKAFAEGELKEQVMRLIETKPKGITLPQMGKALKIPYIRLAKPVSELVKEGKVKKEDSQYFPV